MSGIVGDADTRLFVGRGAELDALGTFAAEAWAGKPRLVMVEGDAGVGKSSLLRRVVAELGGWHVLRASGDEAELMVPYGVIDQLVGSADAEATEGLDLLLRLRDSSETAIEPSAVGAELLRLFGNLQADDQPVVLVVDDLHWCDTPSAQAILLRLDACNGIGCSSSCRAARPNWPDSGAAGRRPLGVIIAPDGSASEG